MTRPRRALVREVNPHLICVLCSGYFIEATTIIECLHSFCRSCLVKYLENSKFCPICDVQLHKNNPLLSVRCDPTLQQLVYKLIPGLYAKEMMRRRQYYAELGGPSSDPDSADQFPVGDAYFSPEDSISLSLEFLGGSKDDDAPASDSDEQTLENQNFHHRRYLQCPAAVTMSHLQKFLRMKYGLGHDLKVDIIYEGEVLTEDFSLMDVAYTFNWKRTTPMRFKFRLLQKNAVAVTVGAKETTVVKDTPPSNKPAGPVAKSEVDAKSLASKMKQPIVQVQKISTVSANQCSNALPAAPVLPVKVPKARKSFDKAMKRSCLVDVQSEPERKKMKTSEPEQIVRGERKKNYANESGKMLKVEPLKQPKVVEIDDDDDDDEERDYMDDIIQEDEELEENDEDDRLRTSSFEEDSMVEERESKRNGLSKRELETEQDIHSYRSEEKRREKKKSKKAKHHHHHRHHDRKRDSPPAATILHSSENDIMKLKIKLTDVNSKPKYSVVDGNEEKLNGHSPKYYEKYVEKESKNKYKEEETKKVVNNNNNSSNSNNNNNNNHSSSNSSKAEPTKLKIDTSNKEKLSLMRNIRLKPSTTVKSPPPLKDSPVHVTSPGESPKASPVHKNSPSPKPVIPTTTLKPTPPIIKPESVKLPSSSITVSKITAAEKAQLDQQKLLMNRNGSNGLDSKRPSLEIMLVNAPKKVNESTVDPIKPVEVKKVMRPTPPSIPLSRLNKSMFGNKTSPPPLVLASNKQSNSLDESGVLDLSGKSSRKSPDMELAMRNLVTLSDTATHVRNLMSTLEPLKIPIVPNSGGNNNNHIKPGFQNINLQRSVKPVPNQTVRQIPNPSALFRQHNGGGRSIPPPVIPINSLRKIESMTKNLGLSKNIDKVAAGLSLKASIEAGYAVK